MRGAGTDWAGIAEAAMILQFYSLCQQVAADSLERPAPVGARIRRHRTSRGHSDGGEVLVLAPAPVSLAVSLPWDYFMFARHPGEIRGVKRRAEKWTLA